MSATTQPTDFSDLYTALLNAAREDTSATATLNQAKRYINTALYDMHIGYGEKFPWAERHGQVNTHPTYSTGTIDVNQGSAMISGTSTAWTSSNAYGQDNMQAFGYMRISGETYRVARGSPAGATTTQIDEIYAGDDDSGIAYTYFEDEYALADDFLRPIDLTKFSTEPYPIDLVPRNDFRRRVAGKYVLGRPTVATIFDRTSLEDATAAALPIRRLKLWRIPDDYYRIKYRYVTAYTATDSTGVGQESLSADADQPIVPIRYRHVIVLGALYAWYRDKKDDARSREVEANYTGQLARICGDSEIGSTHARIQPRVTGYRRRSRRPWSGGLGKYDVTGAFDRLEDL